LANKLPSIISVFKTYKPTPVDFTRQKVISYSQMSLWSSCPHKWALQYRDGHKIQEPSVNLIFGTAMHRAIQTYLETFYNESKTKADELDTVNIFLESFKEEYKVSFEKNKKAHFSSTVEMAEFYEDGIEILSYLKKNQNRYFTKRGWHLIGIELPISLTPNNTYKNVIYNGFLDLVLYNEETNSFYIYDIKTSRASWTDKAKKDETKQAQLILYKEFFSKTFNIPKDNINIEFFIVKRKLWENSDYPQSRVQQFKPASGKIKISKALASLNEFIESCFNLDGSYKDVVHPQYATKENCKYCPFKNRADLCTKGIS